MPTNVTAPRPCSPRSMLPLAWSRPAIISAAGASSYLDFMNRVVAEHAGREIHVILDNLNTDKPKHDRWLTRHKNVHFHFTPTHASWLNQVEVWFSILSAKALAGASFTSPRQVRNQIDAFIKADNQTAHPFEWTKQVVFSQHPRDKYANLTKF